MSAILRIKRSATAGNPSTLGAGEFAYSSLPDNGSNGGDRLYIGTGNEVNGDAVSHTIIGGKFFTDMLDHAKGTTTANSALLVDANKKLNELLIDNITIDGNAISSTSGALDFTAASGDITFNNSTLSGVANPTDSADATPKAYVDSLLAAVAITIVGDSGTDQFNASTGALNALGGVGLRSLITNDTVTFNLENTNVTAGSYGSTTSIPTFTVDAQGRLTAASQVNVATTITVNDDVISLIDSDLSFSSSGNLSHTYTSDTNTIDYSLADASTSVKGAASFNTDDFGVVSGAVSLNDAVVKLIGTDSDDATASAHKFNIVGSTTQGVKVTGVGANVTVSVGEAGYSQLGVSKFESGDFVVNNGGVSIDSDFLRTIETDTGNVTISGHGITLKGDEGINVTHSGTDIIVQGEDATATNKGIASFASTDFDVNSGAVSIKAGSIANGDLANDGITIGNSDTSLGATITDLTGLTGATVDNIRIDGNKISTLDSSGVLYLDPWPEDSDAGTVVIQGNLTVRGIQTTINSQTVTINDHTLVLADSAGDASAANGAGLVVGSYGSSPSLTYAASGNKWVSNRVFDFPADGILLNGVTLHEEIEDHLAGNFFAVGEGLDIVYDDNGNTLTFSAEVSTVTNNGVASFDSDQFTVTAGLATVTVLDGGTY